MKPSSPPATISATVRALAYIRVSRLSEDAISPDVQRDEISRYAEAKGWMVTGWYEDLDVSGRGYARKKREGLDRMLEEALSGHADVVVFYRIDRLAREEEDFHALLGVLQRAGIHCDSVGNPNDGTAESALLWSISAALAKYESVRLGARLRDVHKRLAKEGRWSGGTAPFGMRHVQDELGSRLVCVPEEAATRLWMHERYQEGWALARIAKDLNERGIPTVKGRKWYEKTIASALAGPLQVGARLVDGKLVFGGNIEPIIPLEVYQRTLLMREARRGRPQGGRPARVPLTGRHVKCGTCGSPLYARYADRRRGTDLYYLCYGRRHGLCSQGVAIQVEKLLPYVEDKLFRRLRESRAPRPLRPAEAVGPLLEDTQSIEQSLGRLTAMYVSGDILEAEYHEARGVQLGKLQEARRRLERAVDRTQAQVQVDMLEELWEELGKITPAQWGALGVQEQRDIYDLILDRVIVNPAKQTPRIRVIWR
ncbi:MAG: recombinase family protein [Actinobacteria bacterium]|nr:recombinase family protein [Actinomycetota bacterium]